jgi:hypothetical protein
MVVRRLDVERLMLAGLPVGQIAAQLGIDRHQVAHVYREVAEDWRREQEDDQGVARALAVQRLTRDLAQMRNPLPLRDRRTGEVVEETVRDAAGIAVKRGGRVVKRTVLAEVDWKAVDQHERLLAQIQGTLRPVEVRVDVDATVRASLAAVVASLKPEELDELVAEQEALEARAGGTH